MLDDVELFNYDSFIDNANTKGNQMNNVAINLAAMNKATQSAAEIAVAAIVFGTLPVSERARLGTTDRFGEVVTEIDIVKSVVQTAQREGEAYRYGTLAKILFALPG